MIGQNRIFAVAVGRTIGRKSKSKQADCKTTGRIAGSLAIGCTVVFGICSLIPATVAPVNTVPEMLAMPTEIHYGNGNTELHNAPVAVVAPVNNAPGQFAPVKSKSKPTGASKSIIKPIPHGIGNQSQKISKR